MKRAHSHSSTFLLLIAILFLLLGIGVSAQQSKVGQANLPTTGALPGASPQAMRLKVGDHVVVLWKDGKTYPAQIIEVKEDGYRVHYDGYDSSQDETVEASAIKAIGGSSAAPPAEPAASQKIDWKVGDHVQAQWSRDQKWYKAVILEVKGDSYKVHYEGDSVENDEWVERSRLRSIKASQAGKEWTWTDGIGQTKTIADLQEILSQHKQWLESGGKEGKQATFTNAKLQGVQLPGANLSQAIFIKADLSSKGAANRTNLDGANLSGATLGEVTLHAASMQGTNLSGAKIINSNLSFIDLDGADLTDAKILGADFSKCILTKATLNKAFFLGVKLNDALMGSSDLRDAWLVGDTDLTDATLALANLRGTHFEPLKNPTIRSTAEAYNLEYLTYVGSPAALSQLRNAFKENGLGAQRNKITYAIKRRENEMLREQTQDSKCEAQDCEKEKQQGRVCQNGVCSGERINYLYYYLNLIFFDWTVRYGMKPERALVLLVCLWFVCSLIYDFIIHCRSSTSGIFLIKTRRRRNANHMQGIRILPHHIEPTKGWGHLWRWLRSEGRLLRLSMFFSLMSAFSLGFRGFDVGHWLGLLTKREYELKPKHWARTVVGFQSLLSLYLIAMWILTHFGQPFE